MYLVCYLLNIADCGLPVVAMLRGGLQVTHFHLTLAMSTQVLSADRQRSGETLYSSNYEYITASSLIWWQCYEFVLIQPARQV